MIKINPIAENCTIESFQCVLETSLTNQQHIEDQIVHSDSSVSSGVYCWSDMFKWRFTDSFRACEKLCWINCNCFYLQRTVMSTHSCVSWPVGRTIGFFRGLGGSGRIEVAVWLKGFVLTRWNTSWARWCSAGSFLSIFFSLSFQFVLKRLWIL